MTTKSENELSKLVDKIRCDSCKAWIENGIAYYNCAVPSHCPALEDNKEDANRILLDIRNKVSVTYSLNNSNR